MNKAVNITLIAASAAALVYGSVVFYNYNFRVNQIALSQAINTDTLISGLSNPLQMNVISLIYKEVNNILLSMKDIKMISYVANLDNISFEQQLFNTAKARIIADGYLTVSGTIE